MLDFGARNLKLELEPKAFLKWKDKTTQKVSAAQIGRWKKELSQNDVAAFESVAAAALKDHNYQLSETGISFLTRLKTRARLFRIGLALFFRTAKTRLRRDAQ